MNSINSGVALNLATGEWGPVTAHSNYLKWSPELAEFVPTEVEENN